MYSFQPQSAIPESRPLSVHLVQTTNQITLTENGPILQFAAQLVYIRREALHPSELPRQLLIHSPAKWPSVVPWILQTGRNLLTRDTPSARTNPSMSFGIRARWGPKSSCLKYRRSDSWELV